MTRITFRSIMLRGRRALHPCAKFQMIERAHYSDYFFC